MEQDQECFFFFKNKNTIILSPAGPAALLYPHQRRPRQAYRPAGQVYQQRRGRGGRGGDARALHLPQWAHDNRPGGPARGYQGGLRCNVYCCVIMWTCWSVLCIMYYCVLLEDIKVGFTVPVPQCTTISRYLAFHHSVLFFFVLNNRQ